MVPPAPPPALVDQLGAVSFDLVRIDPDGSAVIAGRAHPGCEVVVLDGGSPIGSVRADERGQWVLLPATPFAPGGRELALRQQCPGGRIVTSDQVVILVVPERGKDVAGLPTPSPALPLAFQVARDGGGGALVMQSPPMQASPAPGTPAITTAGLTTFPEFAPTVTPDEVAVLTLDAVDYAPDGQLKLSGRAPPGTQQRVYLQNQPIGDAEADARGNWLLVQDRYVEPGLYTLRIDQMQPDGTVRARVELPFMRGELLTDLPADSLIVIQPGNNLWRIARRVYGRGMSYTEIYAANSDQIRDPDLIYPGQIFTLPLP